MFFPSSLFLAVAFVSKERSLSDPDLRAAFSAGWYGFPPTHVPDIVGKGQLLCNGSEGDCHQLHCRSWSDIIGLCPVPLMVPSALWMIMQTTRKYFLPIPTFCIFKGCDKLPGRKESGAQRNCVLTNLLLLWTSRLQLTVRAVVCCSELLMALLFELFETQTSEHL